MAYWCQYEYESWDECGDETVGYFDARGWLCKYHAQHYGLLDYTDH